MDLTTAFCQLSPLKLTIYHEILILNQNPTLKVSLSDYFLYQLSQFRCQKSRAQDTHVVLFK